MTTEQLKHFLVAAKHLNFSAAAKELYVTQPAISHQISALEKELGTKLFSRTTRKISLTRSGELFLEDAIRLLDLEDTAKERIRLTDDAQELTLRIAYLLAPCHSFLPAILLEFGKQYPQVSLALTRMDAYNITESMEKESHDLYFSLLRDLDTQSKYAHKNVFTDTYCLICSTEHPCANAAKIDFNKLSSERFLTIDPNSAPFMSRQIRQICRTVGFTPRVTNVISSMEEILFEVESGLGVTILPMRNKYLSPANLAFIPLSGSYTQVALGAAWLQSTDNPAIGWFLDVLNRSMDAAAF